MEPKNGGLEDDFPFELGDFWDPCGAKPSALVFTLFGSNLSFACQGCDWWDTSAVDGYSFPASNHLSSECFCRKDTQSADVISLPTLEAPIPSGDFQPMSTGSQCFFLHVSLVILGCFSCHVWC